MKTKTEQKKYEVGIVHIVDAFRDRELETPETKTTFINVYADSESEALEEAKKADHSHLSVWETFVSDAE